MLKDIIVNLGLNDRDPAADFAVSVAAACEAHVLGVVCAFEPVLPGSVMGGIPPEFIESQRRESDKLAQGALTRFDTAAKRNGVSYETHTLRASIGEAAGMLGKLARRFDLAICTQRNPNDTIPTELMAEALLFESGRPVIMVPYVQKQPLKLDRVMVCWDGGRAATRAIADSLPLLKMAKQVDIVIVAGKREDNKEIPGADLGQHLARHGLKVDVKRLTSPDIDVNSTLLSYAADSNADLIVMGGYGHSRLREFVLGGVTREILSSMTVPVLMSH
jgi:nucleotide-binding universal stress UspA family protein